MFTSFSVLIYSNLADHRHAGHTLTPDSVEFGGSDSSGGTIGFHYGKAASATVQLTENASGTLSLVGNWGVSGTSSFTGLITATAGIKSGGSITSDTSCTDNLGSATIPWNAVYARYHHVYDTNKVNVGSINSNTAGTTSTVGKTYLSLGNGTASGTAGNSRGYLYIYDATKFYAQVITKGDFTANRTFTLPDLGGTFVLSSHINRTDALTAENTSYGTVMARGIKAVTTDPGAGSTLTSGTICLVFNS